MTLEVGLENCSTGQGVQIGIYDDCNWENCVVWTGGCDNTGGDYSATFKAGQTYYMFVDGCNGDDCDYTVVLEDLEAVGLPEIDAVTAYSNDREVFLTDDDGDLAGPSNASISRNCYANDVITVCPGEEIQFSLIHAGNSNDPIDQHQDPCNEYSEGIDATFFWSLDWGMGQLEHNPLQDGDGFLPAMEMPSTPGEYQICIDIIDFECSQLFGPVCLEIIVKENFAECMPGSTAIFDDYPILSSLVDVTACGNTVVEVYDFDTYAFIWIDDGNGGILYLNDGTMYCRDSPGLSCRDAYGFGAPTVTWVCDGPGSGGGQEPDLVSDYPWITEVIDFDDCAGITVELYQFGSQVFPYVINGDRGVLYSNSGQVYCTSSLPGFDCIDAYGLDAPLDTWTCDGMPGTTPPIFIEYPFLGDILDPSDCEGIVTVYESGTFRVIFVETSGMNIMYNTSGLLYCTDSPGFSCAEAYGFTDNDIIDVWDCDGLLEEELEERTAAVKEEVEMVVYPNPTDGIVTIAGLQEDKSHPYQLYSQRGGLVHEGSIYNGEQLDFTSLAAGVYMIRTMVDGEIKVSKVIIL